MSLPILRQPKFLEKSSERAPKSEPQYMIVNLKDGKKLVVSSDAYHGVVTAGELYRCVFCEFETVLDIVSKERHKNSQNHRKILEKYPHIEEFSDNLIRKINRDCFYCTICNVIVSVQFLRSHLHSEAHTSELQKATLRVEAYKPFKDSRGIVV